MPPVVLYVALHGCMEITLSRFAEGCYSIDIEDLDTSEGLKFVVNVQKRTFEHVKFWMTVSEADFVRRCSPAILMEIVRCMVRLLVASADQLGPPRAFTIAKYAMMNADLQLMFRSWMLRALKIIKTAHYFAASFRDLANKYRSSALISRRIEAAALSPYTKMGRARLLREFASLTR